MLQPTVFLVFLWTLHVTLSADQKCTDACTCQFNDENETFIDLSTIGRKDGMSRFFVLNPRDQVLYSFNPCYPISYRTQDFQVDVQHPYACKDVAACIITPGNDSGSPPTQRAIGYQASAEFHLDEGDVMIQYSVNGRNTLNVTLKCNKTESLEIHNETSFVLSTSCACQTEADKERCRAAAPPNPKTGGLSTGSILLITFFVIVLVYVGFGILFNFCKGAHGTELLPNYEFWNELPKLIVDGFLFTCSCFGRRSSYADV